MVIIIISGWLFVARWKSHFLTFCDIPSRRRCNKNKWKIRNSFLSIVQSIQYDAILTTLNKQSNYLRLTKCAFLSVLNPLFHHCIDFGFFLLIFIYEQRAHKTLNIIYKHKSNQITQLLQNKTNSDEAIFHYWSSSHIRIHTVAGDFIRSNFVLCVQEYGTWFVVGRGLWAHLSAFLLVICYRIHIIAAHFVRHVSSPDIIYRNMCESSSTRSLSFNICFLRSDSSSRVVLPLLIYPLKCHCFRFKQKLI